MPNSIKKNPVHFEIITLSLKKLMKAYSNLIGYLIYILILGQNKLIVSCRYLLSSLS